MKQGIADGEVYQVKRKEEDIDGGISNASPDWYEYEVWLVNGEVVDIWDSLYECYNGVQQLTKEEAEKALALILREVNEEKCDPLSMV